MAAVVGRLVLRVSCGTALVVTVLGHVFLRGRRSQDQGRVASALRLFESQGPYEGETHLLAVDRADRRCVRPEQQRASQPRAVRDRQRRLGERRDLDDPRARRNAAADHGYERRSHDRIRVRSECTAVDVYDDDHATAGHDRWNIAAVHATADGCRTSTAAAADSAAATTPTTIRAAHRATATGDASASAATHGNGRAGTRAGARARAATNGHRRTTAATAAANQYRYERDVDAASSAAATAVAERRRCHRTPKR